MSVHEDTDAYSFAVILWELLYLEEPWGKVSSHMAGSKVLQGERLPVDYHQQPEVAEVSDSLSCEAVIVT